MAESHHPALVNFEKEYTEKLFEHLSRALIPGPLTYGFEYEFMPTRKMTKAMVEELEDALPALGFKHQADGTFKALDGLDVTFEPGGQLEYGSPPLFGSDEEGFVNLLNHINVQNVT